MLPFHSGKVRYRQFMLEIIVILALIGIIMIAAEVIVPGLIVGIIGATLVIAAIILAYVEFGVETGSFIALGIFGVGLVCLAFCVYLFPRSAFGRWLTLSSQIKSEKEFPRRDNLLGKPGKTLTPLRPSGAALIEGKRCDVVAESGMIGRDETIKVVKVEGTRVVVRLD